MKISKVFLVALSALALWSMGSRHAPAAVLYDGAGWFQGTQSFSDTLPPLPSAGTLTVTLTNWAMPVPLSSLKLIVESTNKVLMTGDASTSPFSSSFSVNAGDVFVQWFGTAQGALGGMYGMLVTFQPTGGNTVPLPTSIALFLSGIGLLLWQRRIPSNAPAQRNGNARNMRGNARDMRAI